MTEIGKFPRRIVSLTPSLTETLFALELGHRVVGVTDSCDYPAEVKEWPHVACWFDPDLEKLAALKPEHRNLTPFVPYNMLLDKTR